MSEPRQPITPGLILTNMLLDRAEITEIVVATRTRDGKVHSYWSDMHNTLTIGLYECGKMSVFSEMTDDNPVDHEG